jgi:hypothetical protein
MKNKLCFSAIVIALLTIPLLPRCPGDRSAAKLSGLAGFCARRLTSGTC